MAAGNPYGEQFDRAKSVGVVRARGVVELADNLDDVLLGLASDVGQISASFANDGAQGEADAWLEQGVVRVEDARGALRLIKAAIAELGDKIERL